MHKHVMNISSMLWSQVYDMIIYEYPWCIMCLYERTAHIVTTTLLCMNEMMYKYDWSKSVMRKF